MLSALHGISVATRTFFHYVLKSKAKSVHDKLCREISAALNDEVVRADEGDARRVWNSSGMQGRGKQEIPEKTRGLAASSGTIPKCEDPEVLQEPSRTVGFTRGFHTLSSIQATNTSLAVVPQSPVVVHTPFRSRTLARRPPSKTAGRWVATERGASQSRQNILELSLNVSETLAVERRSVTPASLAAVGIHRIPRRRVDSHERIIPGRGEGEVGLRLRRGAVESAPAASLSLDRRMNKVLRSKAMLILRKAEGYSTCIKVDLKRGFQKCSFYRGQPILDNSPKSARFAYKAVLDQWLGVPPFSPLRRTRLDPSRIFVRANAAGWLVFSGMSRPPPPITGLFDAAPQPRRFTQIGYQDLAVKNRHPCTWSRLYWCLSCLVAACTIERDVLESFCLWRGGGYGVVVVVVMPASYPLPTNFAAEKFRTRTNVKEIPSQCRREQASRYSRGVRILAQDAVTGSMCCGVRHRRLTTALSCSPAAFITACSTLREPPYLVLLTTHCTPASLISPPSEILPDCGYRRDGSLTLRLNPHSCDSHSRIPAHGKRVGPCRWSAAICRLLQEGAVQVPYGGHGRFRFCFLLVLLLCIPVYNDLAVEETNQLNKSTSTTFAQCFIMEENEKVAHTNMADGKSQLSTPPPPRIHSPIHHNDFVLPLLLGAPEPASRHSAMEGCILRATTILLGVNGDHRKVVVGCANQRPPWTLRTGSSDMPICPYVKTRSQDRHWRQPVSDDAGRGSMIVEFKSRPPPRIFPNSRDASRRNEAPAILTRTFLRRRQTHRNLQQGRGAVMQSRRRAARQPDLLSIPLFTGFPEGCQEATPGNFPERRNPSSMGYGGMIILSITISYRVYGLSRYPRQQIYPFTPFQPALALLLDLSGARAAVCVQSRYFLDLSGARAAVCVHSLFTSACQERGRLSVCTRSSPRPVRSAGGCLCALALHLDLSGARAAVCVHSLFTSTCQERGRLSVCTRSSPRPVRSAGGCLCALALHLDLSGARAAVCVQSRYFLRGCSLKFRADKIN
ncbi:hypothetical protein PR048_000137 [Dryococelus australis]|uniref:Uncharacterized protein n=1 Tax=Dryococelus australis TaxID=614101 RepID=A0ABQ9IDS5_9NEOP|nr:hypothetical protein PR048_000137 [Dryococelus australis]